MKVHYINILLFALPLNILVTLYHVHNQRNHKKTLLRTPKTKPTKTHRTLCECELYTPSNYDNDPEMKEVMKNFNRLTSERFREYEERMEDKRKQCKQQYNKETQQIILKEKIKKELTGKLAVLETNIESNDIPTCVCEKSIADKVEKMCLKCGGVLGGSVAPEFGLIGGNALYAISLWKDAEILAATAAAQKAGEAAGNAAGLKAALEAVIHGLYDKFILSSLGGKELQDIVTTKAFINPKYIAEAVKLERDAMCWKIPTSESHNMFCSIQERGTYLGWFDKFIETNSETIFAKATKAAATESAKVTASETETLKATNIAAVDATCTSYTTAIIASIVAILIIILIMVIIYLILRYCRKRKMKKKLQYIKLLNE
ncbi:PIR protein, putative [Plasmodium sp.]|nr:PIR protein, putative [Plasmodium sp.]